MTRRLTELQFDNTYARLPEDYYAHRQPTPVPKPYLVSFNPAAAALIDLDPQEVKNPDFVEYFSGNKLLPGSQPIAMAYAGHQFGSYVRQLGDGRAILLGEVRNEAGGKWDLHLKGGGPTAFSRGFDGRAVLRSTIREYLCSEALHQLGIPTTRALCITGSNLPVHRETVETAAMLIRLSPSHVRFGTFEFFYYRNRYDCVQQLADYVLEHYYAQINNLAIDQAEKYPLLLAAVVTNTARLIAKWQAVGFSHGVMNTDNMSILGWTIDYGPFGFIDNFDPGFICNHSDHTGRYAFNQQPSIGYWNLQCLAQALLPLMSDEDALAALDQYEPVFSEHYGELMRDKLGLQTVQPEDLALISELLKLLHQNNIDYTNFFRALCDFKQQGSNESLRGMFAYPSDFARWCELYRTRLRQEESNDVERSASMRQANPKYILRNYLAQTAIQKAVEQRNYNEIDLLLNLLSKPFDEQPERNRYAEPPPDWSRQIIVSCSS